MAKIRQEKNGRIVTIKKQLVEELEDKLGSIVGLKTKQKRVGNKIIIEVLDETN